MAQELYELPEGWSLSPIKKLCTKITDGTHKTPTYTERGIHFISVKDITRGTIDFSNTKYITKKEHELLYKRCDPEIGDILYTKVGTTGVAQKVDTETPFSLFVSVALLKPIRELLHTEFFEYILNSPKAYEQAQQRTRGMANRNLVLKDIKEIQIPVPPLAEQKRIVAQLDALFSRIDQTIAQLQDTQAQTKALWASALDAAFATGSDRQEISELCEVKGGKRLPKGKKLQEAKTEYPYIRVADFTDYGTIDLTRIKYITKEIYEQISRYIIHSNDLYISIAGTIGKTGIVPSELNGANLTENAAKLVIKSKAKLNLRFLYLFTLSSDFSSQAGLATKTVAQPKLALTRLSKIEIPLPPLPEQEKIVAQLDAIAERTQALEATTATQLEQLKALKASLLDAAFRGQL